MWISDMTKALYYLNASDRKYYVTIESIQDGIIWFSNFKKCTIKYLADMYDQYMKDGIYFDVLANM